ncbi:hypothetical protein RA876_18920 [Rhodoferax antarcticus]|nr:hypothetical protein RA876_18920 [Rhodoferax antarcticus]
MLLDRGYPAAWLVSVLCERGVCLCMRCDKEVTGCSPNAPEVRMVRNVSPNAWVRVMATNLDPVDFPWGCFGELCHKRWRIEEAFKRLKHHMRLEAVSGLSQQALIIDVASKVLADNMASLPYRCALADGPEAASVPGTGIAPTTRRIWPRRLRFFGCFATTARRETTSRHRLSGSGWRRRQSP